MLNNFFGNIHFQCSSCVIIKLFLEKLRLNSPIFYGYFKENTSTNSCICLKEKYRVRLLHISQVFYKILFVKKLNLRTILMTKYGSKMTRNNFREYFRSLLNLYKLRTVNNRISKIPYI